MKQLMVSMILKDLTTWAIDKAPEIVKSFDLCDEANWLLDVKEYG